MIRYILMSLAFASVLLPTNTSAAACYLPGQRAVDGLVGAIWSPSTSTDGRVQVRVVDGNGSLVGGCTAWYVLQPAAVGSQRFDLMYTILLSAAANKRKVWIAWDVNNYITDATMFPNDSP